MNHRPSNQYSWAAHCMLALLTCLWLYAAQRLDFSFNTTVMVAVAITLCGGFITSSRATRLHRRGQQAVARRAAEVREREAEFDQLIFSMPALFRVFGILRPDLAKSRFNTYEFANWLRWAVCNGNVVDWMMQRPDARGRPQMLRGLTDHIDQERRQGCELYVEDAARTVFSEMRLYYQHGDGSVKRGPQRRRRQEVGREGRRRTSQRGRHRVAT